MICVRQAVAPRYSFHPVVKYLCLCVSVYLCIYACILCFVFLYLCIWVMSNELMVLTWPSCEIFVYLCICLSVYFVFVYFVFVYLCIWAMSCVRQTVVPRCWLDPVVKYDFPWSAAANQWSWRPDWRPVDAEKRPFVLGCWLTFQIIVLSHSLKAMRH